MFYFSCRRGQHQTIQKIIRKKIVGRMKVWYTLNTWRQISVMKTMAYFRAWNLSMGQQLHHQENRYFYHLLLISNRNYVVIFSCCLFIYKCWCNKVIRCIESNKCLLTKRFSFLYLPFVIILREDTHYCDTQCHLCYFEANNHISS